MIFEYFPGCTLKTTGKKLDIYGRLSAEALGFELRELPEWQCCGAVYPLVKDEIAVRLAAVRALAAAKSSGHELVTLCSACHNVIKRTNNDIKQDEELRKKINAYMGNDFDYSGETNVLHYLEVLRDRIGFDEIAKRVKKPLEGKRIGAYYGCLLLRPSKELSLDDPEKPSVLENLMEALGATPVVYTMRNECCGAYTTIENNDYAQKSAKRILDNARNCGAKMIVTACPLCMYNLNKVKSDIKVYYFTELLAEALGVKE